MPNQPVRPSVLAAHLRDDGEMGGCEQYRIRIPFEAVREHVPGAAMDWAPLGKVREWGAGKLHNMPRTPADYDIMVLPRHRPLPYGEDGAASKFEAMPRELVEGIKKLGVELEGKCHLLDLVRLMKAKQKE